MGSVTFSLRSSGSQSLLPGAFSPQAVNICKIADMELENNSKSKSLEVPLQAISAEIWVLAKSHEGDNKSLLALLRTLEQAHREIRESLFQSCLPDNRQNLYALLKDIEESGGWPYVERMKLRSLLVNLPESQLPNPQLGEAGESSP